MPYSAYPVSRFLQRIINDSGLSRSQFIQAIGFKNPSKGLRRLDGWLADGRGDKGCLQRIVDRYHPDPAELESCLRETKAIQEARAEDRRSVFLTPPRNSLEDLGAQKALGSKRNRLPLRSRMRTQAGAGVNLSASPVQGRFWRVFGKSTVNA
jgi:hypothetical protein